jgi:hypothetical protein
VSERERVLTTSGSHDPDHMRGPWLRASLTIDPSPALWTQARSQSESRRRRGIARHPPLAVYAAALRPDLGAGSPTATGRLGALPARARRRSLNPSRRRNLNRRHFRRRLGFKEPGAQAPSRPPRPSGPSESNAGHPAHQARLRLPPPPFCRRTAGAGSPRTPRP